MESIKVEYKIWNRICAGAIALMIAGSGTYGIAAGPVQAQETTAVKTGTTAGKSTAVNFVASESYEAYQAKYKNAARPDDKIVISCAEYKEASKGANPQVVRGLGGKAADVLVTGDTGSVTFSFEVKQAGLYNMVFDYYPVEGKGSDMERALYVDGKLPFEETRALSFYRIWINTGDKKYSSSGNEFRREQKEAPAWISFGLRNNGSNLDEDLSLYFSAGTHTMTLESISEPMALSTITLCQTGKIPAYREVYEDYQTKGYQDISGGTADLKIQAEDPAAKSCANFYSLEDRTSPLNEPFSISKTVLNTIGGSGWAYQGDWIEWKVNVKTEGLYKLSIRAKQNFKSGTFSTRSVSIDGTIPFQEAKNIKFIFNNNWQMITASDRDGNPFLFYLTPGEHTVRLAVSTGDHSEILRSVSKSVKELSAVYRKVIMLTGSMPDSLRDYKLHKSLPEIFPVMEEQIKILADVNDKMAALSGEKGEAASTIDKLLVLLRIFNEKPDKIPENLTYFNDNISALASWILSAAEQPLLLDYLVFQAPSAEKPAADASFFSKLIMEVKSFALSFVNDYNTIDDYSKSGKVSSTVELWLAGNAGRDQATTIKTLSDNYFGEEKGIRLTIRLVDMDVLLRSVSANRGPDVAIFQSQSTPINYALRSALQNLSEFDDIDEVVSRFSKSAMIPLEWNHSVYALPEQQTFLMMFYRKDVLHDLNLAVPDTWEDFYAMIPTLQNNNLCIGLPSPVKTQSGGTATALNDLLVALLYQKGLNIYTENGDACVLNTPEAVDVFTAWTELYTKYKVDKEINEINRFRTGEAPVVLTSYPFYNSLMVAAPEINGLWGMAPIPGTLDKNGNINRSVGSSGSNVIMFRNADDKNAAWEFMKWWTSAKIQTLYGREIEILQGTSARWPTANIEAMKNLPWPTEISNALQEQWKQVKGVPEVAGGYYVGRNIDNAIKQVINQGENPRETILDYIDQINEEITYKRRELGLE